MTPSSDAQHTDSAPIGLSGRHPATLAMLRHFEYRHLVNGDLQAVSKLFADVAHELAHRLPDSAELSVALRKLLEGKDAAVRAAVEDLRSRGRL